METRETTESKPAESTPAPAAPAAPALPALLADADVGALLLRPLTVQEAGRALRGACRAALALVRAAETAGAETRTQRQSVFRPMWNTDGALARLQRYRQPIFRPWLIGELESLARVVLDELVPAGVVVPFFWLDKARDGQPPTLLGCHELRVADPVRWVQRLQEWALTDSSCAPAPASTWGHSEEGTARMLRHKYPGGYVTDLLRDMRLMGTTRGDFSPDVRASLPEEVLESSRRLCVRVWVQEW